MESKYILARDGSQLFNDDVLPSGPPAGPPSTVKLLVALLGFFFIGSCCAAVFLMRRRRRRAIRNALLPVHHHRSHQRHSTISTNSDFVKPPPMQSWEEKDVATGSFSPSGMPPQIPELRLTFPDDEGEKTNSGKVVVVHVSDSGSVGMAPVIQDHLPPYQSSSTDDFHSLELNLIGGLKEKNQGPERSS